MDPVELTLLAGEEKQITVTVSPTNATNRSVTWASDNEEVATVVNGLVTGVKLGTATITATSVADNTKIATTEVIVFEEEKAFVKETGEVFDTIQEAVNAANEGNTILVGSGTFEIDDTLNITKPLTIKGMGPEKTIIDVTKVTDEHNCWGVLVGKSNTVLCDLAIVSTNGRAKYNNLKVSGEFADPVEHIEDIVIKNVLIQGGKGLDIYDADVALDNVTVQGSQGASIAVSDGSNVTISDCTTTDGDWGSVGVMYKDGYSKSIVTVGDGNEFGEGVLYREGYKAESGNVIEGLGVEWFSYVNVEKDQLLWVKELSKGAFIEAESGPNHWYATIQSAVDAATEGDTILVGPGEYDVSYVDETTKHYLLIEKPVTIKAADMSNKPVLVADYTKIEGQAGHQQATVHIFETKNLTLDGLVVHSISNYPTTFTKAVEITGSNNVTVKNCDIYDEGRTAIYIADPSVGKYTIADNYLDGAIVVANGAGNGEGGSEATITGNTINASISFTGKTNSGWDHNHVGHYPTIEGNIINGTDYGMLFNSRDEDKDKLILDSDLEFIKKNNVFPDGDIRIVQDSYDYHGGNLHRKRLVLNTVVNLTRESIHPTIQDAIDEAGSGNTILLSMRTYTENVIINKPLTITGPDSASDKPVINGSFTVNHSSDIPTVIKNLSFVTGSLSPVPDDKNQDNIVLSPGVQNVTISNCEFDAGGTGGMFMDAPSQGFRAIQMPSGTKRESITIEDCTFSNGYYVTIQGYVNHLTVKDSIIENCKSGINVQGGGNLVVENTDVDVVAQAEGNNTYCVRFGGSGVDTDANMSITGGTFILHKDGVGEPTGDKLHSAIIVRAGATGNLTIENATIDGEVVDFSGELDLDEVLLNNTFERAVVLDGKNVIYSEIQTAVTAWENAENGNYTITITDGTYNENSIVIKQQVGKSLTIKAENKLEAVLVNKSDVDSTGVFHISGGSSYYTGGITFEGIRFELPAGASVNCFGIKLLGEGDAGGTANRYANDVTVKNCEFFGSVEKSCAVWSGAKSQPKTILIEGCKGDGLTALYNGYGSDITIKDSNLSNARGLLNSQSADPANKLVVEGVSAAIEYQLPKDMDAIKINGGTLTIEGSNIVLSYNGDTRQSGLIVIRGEATVNVQDSTLKVEQVAGDYAIYTFYGIAPATCENLTIQSDTQGLTYGGTLKDYPDGH